MTLSGDLVGTILVDYFERPRPEPVRIKLVQEEAEMEQKPVTKDELHSMFGDIIPMDAVELGMRMRAWPNREYPT